MVYRGKPSKACSECRIKRRKCDLMKPACRHCIKAGSRCEGYRDENFLTFQDQTAATLEKIDLFSNTSPILISPHGSQVISQRPEISHQVEPHRFKKRGHCPWSKISVKPTDQALHFFFHHYVVSGSGRAFSHPDCLGVIYARAIGPGYLANLINAVGLISLAYLRNAPNMAQAAIQTYSRALREIRVALADSREAASDQMLVAVMLLALYELVSPGSDGNSGPWDRHVNGALALMQLRGAGQLRNRISRSILFNLSTEILINCLQRGLRVPVPFINWMADARRYETVQEAPAAKLADMVVKVCSIMASAKEDCVDNNLSRHISTLLSIDSDLERWAKALPEEYEYTTLTGINNPNGFDVYMGRSDVYPSAESAHIWNLQRCARMALHRILAETLSTYFHNPSSKSKLLSVPVSYEDLSRASDTVVQESSNAICYSVPYILHAYDKAGKLSDLRAARAVHILWPLYIAGTARGVSDAMRDWIVSTMKQIEEVTGIQNAKILALDIQRLFLSH